MTPVHLLLAMSDVGLLVAAFTLEVHPGNVLIAHTLLCVTSLGFWWKSGRRRRFAPLVGIPLGSIGIACFMIGPSLRTITRRWHVTRWDARKPVPAQMEPPAEEGSGNAMVARLLDGRVHHPDPAALGSLIGIMRHGNVDDRRLALETVVRKFDPRLSAIVAKALSDKDQTIRALAAAAASFLAQRLIDMRSALTRAQALRDEETCRRLSALLLDHSQFNRLLSDVQRRQIEREARQSLATDNAELEDEHRWRATVNRSWNAGDFEGLDALCDRVVAHNGAERQSLYAAAHWWNGKP